MTTRATQEPAREPQGFGVRQSSAALFPTGHDRKRQRTAALQDAVACRSAPCRVTAARHDFEPGGTPEAPADTVILTLACGKYRFYDKDLGTIDGIPRLLDMGQCNDAYSAIQVALALADAFEVGVNDLPLTLILSWYEQKAAAILLTLLYLGLKDMRLGPTLPAFLTPDVVKFIVDTYDLHPITTPEEDLQTILA